MIHQDVQQWLTEIQALKQRLSQVMQERTDAYQQAYRWQQSYQTEAQQRRKDTRRLQTVIYKLDQKNKELTKRLPPAELCPPLAAQDELEDEVRPPENEVPPSNGLKRKLAEAIALCDRLSKALAEEQAEHHQTRETLMTALSDTIEQLERERKKFVQQSSPQSSSQMLSSAPSAKTPSPGQQQKLLGLDQPSSVDSAPV